MATLAHAFGGGDAAIIATFFGSLKVTAIWVLSISDRYALGDSRRAILVLGSCCGVVTGWCMGLAVVA
jgi:hypothetical protein